MAQKNPSRLVITLVIIVAAVLTAFGVKEGIKRFREGRQRDAQAAQWGLDRKAADRIDAILEREMLPLSSSPEFKKRLEQEGKADAKGFGRALVARGIGRLSDTELLDFHGLRKRTAFASERTCACYWDSSSCADADIMDGLSRLTDPELTAWMRLSAAAGKAELAADKPLPSSRSEFEAGLVQVMEHLQPKERERLTPMIQATTPPPKAEQCAAMRLIFSGADALASPARIQFIRAFSSMGNR